MNTKNIFKDDRGTKFTWKVSCIPKMVNPEKEKCRHCNGVGKILDPYDSFYDINCDFCHGTGKRDVTISCYDPGLEEFLEKMIPEYYKQQENNFLGENI